MDRKTGTVLLAVSVAVALLCFTVRPTDGPATRCADAGGQMLVGPGGETSCIDRRTFLPLEGF